MFPRHRERHPVLSPGVKRANGHGYAHPGLGGAVSWSQRKPGTGTAPGPIHPHEESPFIGVLHSLPDSHLWGSCLHSGEPVYRDPTPEPTGSGTAAAPGRALSPSTNKVLQRLGGENDQIWTKKNFLGSTIMRHQQKRRREISRKPSQTPSFFFSFRLFCLYFAQSST